ncbi:MAG: permease-like cell division protein FtsX [Patescibacteria group bacterium]
MRSLYRIANFAFQDIVRNLGLSFMTILILVLMLLSVNTLWSLDIVTGKAVQMVRDQVTISFYLSADVTDQNTTELKSFISTFPEVVALNYLSREEVLKTFKDNHKYSPEILQALDELGGNPFGPTITVRTREPGDYRKILEALSVPEYEPLIESKSFSGNESALDRIQLITNRIEGIGFGLSLLFAIIAFLIIFNTIRVSIHSQRIEISIKRLVGANNWFIRGPYWLEAGIFTLLSIVITMVIVFVSLSWLDRYIGIVLGNQFSLTDYYRSHMLYLFGSQALAVLLLTITSSSFAMRRQLKV